MKRILWCSWCIWFAALSGCSDAANSPDEDSDAAAGGSIASAGNGSGKPGASGSGNMAGRAGGGGSNAGAGTGEPEGDSEITCPDGVVEGKVVLRTTADIEALLPCTKVMGSVLFYLEGEIELPNLEHVGGDLDVNDEPTAISAPALKVVEGGLILWLSDSIVDVSLPALESVGNVKIEDSPALVSVHLPLLTSAQHFHVETVDSLTTLEVPALATVFDPLEGLTGEVSFYGAPKLRSVELPSLRNVEGAVAAHTNETLETFELPMLETTNQLMFGYNPMLKAVSLPQLKECTGDYTAIGNDVLESISMPLLEHVVGFMFIAGNPALAELALPSFVRADNDSLTIRDNETLPQCAVDEIVSRLDPPVASLTLDNNLGTCP